MMCDVFLRDWTFSNNNIEINIILPLSFLMSDTRERERGGVIKSILPVNKKSLTIQ